MIRRNRYKTITDELSFAIRDNDYILESVNQIQTDITALIDLLDSEEIFETNTDAFVLTAIDSAADAYASDIENNSIDSLALDSLVSSVQEHIETHFEEVNDYLVNNAIQLREEFADKSTSLSYGIDRSNYLYITLPSEGIFKASSNVSVALSVDPLETATVTIDGEDFIVRKSSTGQLVWDYGGAGQHTFTSVGETISRSAGSTNFDITYQGTPGLLFDIDFT